MLRKFKIRIDGKEYQVEMEEEGTPQVPIQPAPPATAPAPVAPAPAEPAAQPAPAASVPASSAGADAIKAPMPGAILKILVNIGDQVEVNQPLMILEAMKMENQIVADKAGTVSGIHVTVGNQVNPGDALITLA